MEFYQEDQNHTVYNTTYMNNFIKAWDTKAQSQKQLADTNS